MITFKRRDALRVAAGSVATLASASVKATAATPAPLRVVISLNGKAYEYREEAGKDLGDFVSPIGGFTQRCVRSTAAGSPITVFFRPDRNSERAEVVFELGKLFNTTPANLGSYTVLIYRGSTVLASVNVPVHYWFSRWRWQSAARPVVAAVSTLISSGLLPPYARTANAGTVVPVSKQLLPGMTLPVAGKIVLPAPLASQTYTVMGLAGITPYMPQTGERPDIGLVTEHQARFICTDDPASLQTLMAQGEAAGTVPWHMRDENTGAPLNFNSYPKASWYVNGSPGSPHIPCAATPVAIESAHMPALAYVPYLLTGDPYYLETLQFQANWDWGAMPPSYRPNIPQARAFAWSMRNLSQAARMTPANVPSWLLPASYWYARLENIRLYFEANFVNSMRPERAIFRCCTPIDSSGDNGPTEPPGTWVDPWEDEFVAAVLGWVISMGFTSWRTAFDWKIGSTIARTNGTSGWIRAQSTPYRMILRYTATSAFAANWKDAFGITKAVQKLAYTDPDTWYNSDITYLTYTRGALVYALRLGTPNASACLNWAAGQINARGRVDNYKWQLG